MQVRVRALRIVVRVRTTVLFVVAAVGDDHILLASDVYVVGVAVWIPQVMILEPANISVTTTPMHQLLS